MRFLLLCFLPYNGCMFFGNKRKISEDDSITNCFDYDQNYSNDELKFIIRRLQEENKYKSEKIDELVEEHNSNQERKEKEWSKELIYS